MIIKEDDVLDYLDLAIKEWKLLRDNHQDETATYYIDAFASVKETLFGITDEEIEN